jgi:hypothetical protein
VEAVCEENKQKHFTCCLLFTCQLLRVRACFVYMSAVDPHVSNFDWTGCLAGCEERWGPGGREVDGRRVTLWDPSVILVQTQQEACGRWKIYTHTTLCTNYAVWEWV